MTFGQATAPSSGPEEREGTWLGLITSGGRSVGLWRRSGILECGMWYDMISMSGWDQLRSHRCPFSQRQRFSCIRMVYSFVVYSFCSIWLPSPWGVLNRFGKWISTEHSTERSVLEEQHLWILFPGLESDEGRGKCDFPSRNSQTTNGVRKTNVLLWISKWNCVLIYFCFKFWIYLLLDNDWFSGLEILNNWFCWNWNKKSFSL